MCRSAGDNRIERCKESNIDKTTQNISFHQSLSATGEELYITVPNAGNCENDSFRNEFSQLSEVQLVYETEDLVQCSSKSCCNVSPWNIFFCSCEFYRGV